MKIWRVKEFGAVVIALAVFAGAEAQSRGIGAAREVK